MITESPLQFRAGKSLSGKESGKRAAALLRLRGAGREHRHPQRQDEQLFHGLFIARLATSPIPLFATMRRSRSNLGAAVIRAGAVHIRSQALNEKLGVAEWENSREADGNHGWESHRRAGLRFYGGCFFAGKE